MIEIRWHGRGGQGGFTAARLLGAAAALFEHKYALAFPSFGPERRGAPVLGFTRIDDRKITDRSEVRECDYVVVLDETLVDASVVRGLKPGGTVVLNSADPKKYEALRGFSVRAIDATALALEILKKPITNTAMLGALAAVSAVVHPESLVAAVEREMKPALAAANRRILETAFARMQEVPA